MGSLIRLNPRARDQGMRLFTLAVAVPALLYTGLQYPGTWKSKALILGAAGLLVYGNYSGLRKPAEWIESSDS
jgi:hypothetical protein